MSSGPRRGIERYSASLPRNKLHTHTHSSKVMTDKRRPHLHSQRLGLLSRAHTQERSIHTARSAYPVTKNNTHAKHQQKGGRAGREKQLARELSMPLDQGSDFGEVERPFGGKFNLPWVGLVGFVCLEPRWCHAPTLPSISPTQYHCTHRLSYRSTAPHFRPSSHAAKDRGPSPPGGDVCGVAQCPALLRSWGETTNLCEKTESPTS